MKGYVKRRALALVDPLPNEPKERPKLFSTKGYLNDLDSMIQTEYVAQIDEASKHREAMVKMLVDLELIQKEK